MEPVAEDRQANVVLRVIGLICIPICVVALLAILVGYLGARAAEPRVLVRNETSHGVTVSIGGSELRVEPAEQQSVPLREVGVMDAADAQAQVSVWGEAIESPIVVRARRPAWGDLRVLLRESAAGESDDPVPRLGKPRTGARFFSEAEQLTVVEDRALNESTRLLVELSHPCLVDYRNSIGMDFKLVPPGTFGMGTPPRYSGANAGAVLHTVTLTRPLFVGVTEVTNSQWARVMGSTPGPAAEAPCPVGSVSWDDAVEFCRKLSLLDGRTYRLPTEAEWEYACRAGSTMPFITEDDPDPCGWWAHNAPGRRPQPVRGRIPNRWGLHDMHGNVEEWCSDWFALSYPLPAQVDPTGPSGGSERVARGGGVSCSDPFQGSSFERNSLPPTTRFAGTGFRVVCEAPLDSRP